MTAQSFIGIIAFDASVGASGSEPPRCMFRLQVWRDEQNRIRSEELQCEIDLPGDDKWSVGRELAKTLPRHLKVQVHGEFRKRGAFKYLLLDSPPTPVQDSLLDNIAKALAQDTYVDDAVFGKLAATSESYWFEGHALWGQQEVKVQLVGDERKRDPYVVLGYARHIWMEQRKWDSKARDYLKSEVLSHINNVWREDEPPLDEASFLHSLRLTDVNVNQNGKFTLWYDPQDSLVDELGGHGITLTCDCVSDTITDFDMPG